MAKANLTHPGKANYTGPKAGMFTHIHHRSLIEWSDDIMERIEHIKTEKDPHERPVRLKSIVHVPLNSNMPYGMRMLGEAALIQAAGASHQADYYVRVAIDALWNQELRKQALGIACKLAPKGVWQERKGCGSLVFPKPKRRVIAPNW